MKLVVGLGNPGEQYIGTRHNLGFLIVDEYIKKHLDVKSSSKFWSREDKFKAEVGKIEEVLFARPQTYMNRSGMSISAIANYYKISPNDIIIIHDELDLPIGQIKIRLGGAAAGHHGVESIIEALNTDKFVRLRLGIGTLKALSGERKNNSFSAEKFVLNPFTQKENAIIKKIIKQALKALDILFKDGLNKAQNQFN